MEQRVLPQDLTVEVPVVGDSVLQFKKVPRIQPDRLRRYPGNQVLEESTHCPALLPCLACSVCMPSRRPLLGPCCVCLVSCGDTRPAQPISCYSTGTLRKGRRS